ncbi:MAG: hypothetical protein LBI84_09445, partial [Propionibacteriaceae bacterium]|nr:hypothetical protein [Propionibacteriaceae bacterium]
LDLRAIGAAADLDEVNRQLTGLRRPLCSPAQVDLAAALAHDAADYLAVLDDISRRAQVPPAQRGGVSLAFHGVEEALADLAAQAADIDAALTALDDGDPATDDDLLDAVAGKIAQIEAALDAGSGFQAALDSLTGLVSTTEPHRLNGFQSGVVAPLGAAPGAAACADALAASGSDLLSADAVLFHSNQLTCQTMAFGVAMAEWHAAATAAYATAADSLAKAQTQTVQTFNDSANRVHVVSDRLVEALTTTDPDGAAVSLVWPDYAQIDAAERLAQDRMRDTAARFGDSADGIVAALSEQVNASAADSLAARETLGAAFETLMANLGGAGLDSRVGMLGKLRGIAAQVGDTGAVLSALVQATAAYGNDRAADLRAVKLRAAEFQVVQDSSTDYPAFAGAPDGTQNLATVFSFHVGGRK